LVVYRKKFANSSLSPSLPFWWETWAKLERAHSGWPRRARCRSREE